jgi:hypothetical protein
MNDVFAPIIDIWGFIMCYNPILEKLYYNYGKLNAGEIELFNELKSIFLKYLFEPRVEPIKTDELVKELKVLNKLFEKCDNSKTSHSFNGVASGINNEIYEHFISHLFLSLIVKVPYLPRVYCFFKAKF